MMLPIEILLPWLSTIVLVLAACRAARIGDAEIGFAEMRSSAHEPSRAGELDRPDELAERTHAASG